MVILKLKKNSHWKKVSIKLTVPIAFTPIISNDHLLIVGYGIVSSSIDGKLTKVHVSRLPVAIILQHHLIHNATMPYPPDGLN